MATEKEKTFDLFAPDFQKFVQSIKADIQNAQIRASIRVNSELIHLYWQMGMQIVEQQASHAWGDGFLKSLSQELMHAFPEMKGLSYTNLRYIKPELFNEAHS